MDTSAINASFEGVQILVARDLNNQLWFEASTIIALFTARAGNTLGLLKEYALPSDCAIAQNITLCGRVNLCPKYIPDPNLWFINMNGVQRLGRHDQELHSSFQRWVTNTLNCYTIQEEEDSELDISNWQSFMSAATSVAEKSINWISGNAFTPDGSDLNFTCIPSTPRKQQKQDGCRESVDLSQCSSLNTSFPPDVKAFEEMQNSKTSLHYSSTQSKVSKQFTSRHIKINKNPEGIPPIPSKKFATHLDRQKSVWSTPSQKPLCQQINLTEAEKARRRVAYELSRNHQRIEWQRRADIERSYYYRQKEQKTNFFAFCDCSFFIIFCIMYVLFNLLFL